MRPLGVTTVVEVGWVEVVYRAARPEDVAVADEIHRVTRDQMLTRNNLPVPQHDPATGRADFQHVLETGIFEVAEVGGRVAAVCHAVVRDQVWFLSSFWVLPEFQNRGIGGPLTRRVTDAGEAQGAGGFCVWSSVDPTAIATYMKLGMMPGTQLLKFSAVEEHASLPAVPDGYEKRPLEPEDAMPIDRVVRATAREVDHRFWAGQSFRRGRLVLHRGKPCGYYYILDSGDVAPAAWLAPVDGDAVLTLACRDGLDQAGKTGLKFVGSNHQAIRFALQSGFQFDGYSHFLTTSPFGKLDQYVVSGPLLF